MSDRGGREFSPGASDPVPVAAFFHAKMANYCTDCIT